MQHEESASGGMKASILTMETEFPAWREDQP